MYDPVPEQVEPGDGTRFERWNPVEVGELNPSDIVQLIGSSLWPIVVLVVSIQYRRPIGRLIDRIRDFEGLGLKGAFSLPAENAVEAADRALREIDVPDLTSQDPEIQTLIRQTATQPWWAVHQAYRIIRGAAKEASESSGLTDSFGNTSERVKALRDNGVVGEEIYRLADLLRSLYYEMKREPELLTPPAASDFVEAAAKLAQTLREVGRRSRESRPLASGDRPVE